MDFLLKEEKLDFSETKAMLKDVISGNIFIKLNFKIKINLKNKFKLLKFQEIFNLVIISQIWTKEKNYGIMHTHFSTSYIKECQKSIKQLQILNKI